MANMGEFKIFPKIIEILRKSNGYESFDRICETLKKEFSSEASTPSHLEQKVSDLINLGCTLGLISGSSDHFKLAVNLSKPEDETFQSRLQILNQELSAIQASNPDSPDANAVASAPAEPMASGSRVRRPDDCGPGWNRRPLAQRQAIAIRRRLAAQEKVRQKMRAARQRRGRSRSRSRSRSGHGHVPEDDGPAREAVRVRPDPVENVLVKLQS
uniref:Uncharacterized protein n=1 Tax=Aedes albopictus TaxID=7160 RepID=A0A023EJR2_AEDAL